LEFRDISCVLEAITAKQMKMYWYCQRRNCSPRNVLFSDVYRLRWCRKAGALNNGEIAKQVFIHTQLW